MKTAIFYKRSKQLLIWRSRNTCEYINCSTLLAAITYLNNEVTPQLISIDKRK